MERIIQVIGSVEKAGVESIVCNYYKHIDRNKFQFDFIVHDDSTFELSEEILKLGCKVYSVPHYRKLFSYIKTLTKIFTEGKYRIVHSHMSTISVFSLFAAKKAKVPIRIAHSHGAGGQNKDEFIKNILRRLLCLFSKIYPTHLFACSEYAGRWMFGNKAYKQGKITIIHNAIDHTKFLYNEEIREKVRAKLGITDKFVVGHVGRFMPQKNHGFLIEIFYELHKMEKDSVLLLVGEGKTRAYFEEKVKKLNLQDCVFFLGGRTDVNELYQAMDVFLLPSLYEGLPVVLVETQFAGLPAIISDDVNEEARFSDKIDFLSLDENPETWAKAALCKRVRDRSTTNFLGSGNKYHVETSAGDLADIYEKLIQEIEG